ncbi:hypothetical protein VCHA36P166_130060 [Vibrio chagasii]|nr:hypothetical protein VCHA36P166_130060 [Vibrio chagasii]
MIVSKLSKSIALLKLFCTVLLFYLGKVVCTQGIAKLLNKNIGVNLPIYLHRHQNGHRGSICVEDKLMTKPPNKRAGFIQLHYL